MAARVPTTVMHRDYAGSAEEIAGDPAAEDQQFAAAEVNDFLATHINHAALINYASLKYYTGYDSERTWVLDQNNLPVHYHAATGSTAEQRAVTIPGTDGNVWVLTPGGATETNDLTSAVTWANVPDANVTESSVTQHETALTITESQIIDLTHAAGDLQAANNLSEVTPLTAIKNLIDGTAVAAKATPVNADKLLIQDSESADVLKHITFGDTRATDAGTW